MSVERVRRRRSGAYHLSVTAFDDSGNRTPISGDVSVLVRDGAGAQVASAVPTLTDGVLSYDLDATAVPFLDVLRVEWSGTAGGIEQTWEADLELVGEFIVEVADIRASNRAFADPNNYPAATLAEDRDGIEEFLEENGMCAFRPRGARAKLSGTGVDRIVLPDTDLRRIYSCTVDGVPMTPDELAELRVSNNVVWRPGVWRSGFANIEIHYEYGYDRAPAPIKRAALLLAKEYIVPSNIPARATAATVGDMAYRITVAGRDGFSGIPDVDAAIMQFGRVRPVVG